MVYGWLTITCLLFFLVGYTLGRRIGIKEGYNKGVAYSPLLIKEEVYKNKKCPICNKQN